MNIFTFFHTVFMGITLFFASIMHHGYSHTETLPQKYHISPHVSFSPTPTTAPLHTESNNTNNTPTQEPSSEISWVYPGARSIGENTYESTDNSDIITNWYKDRIAALGYNTTSFVTTKTNGNVQNQLSASNGTTTIRIYILKESTQATTTIKISYY